MTIHCVWEHNGDDSLLYAIEAAGAFTRGASRDEALRKMPGELADYLLWAREPAPEALRVVIAQEKASALRVADADSDVLFDAERAPLTEAEYRRLKALALRSAGDFLALYEAAPDRDASALPARDTFYGPAPRTAREMYEHTKSVNAYYFGEIGVEADNEGTILECRERGFRRLEQAPGFLENPVCTGSYGEQWSLRKVLRRFVWHDRIHAKAMYRMAVKTFGRGAVENIFCFGMGWRSIGERERKK